MGLSPSSEKEQRPRFASPENRVLPVTTGGPQKLRTTDNGHILHSGGTISGRKAPFGHRKSHSDPDLVRQMLEEDNNYTLEPRSIRALSPSKAKIKSRKKKKAPEPPNTLPRTVPYEAPRRPLPPIPPNPNAKNFQKNRRLRRPQSLDPIPQNFDSLRELEKIALNEAIVDAVNKRSERLARTPNLNSRPTNETVQKQNKSSILREHSDMDETEQRTSYQIDSKGDDANENKIVNKLYSHKDCHRPNWPNLLGEKNYSYYTSGTQQVQNENESFPNFCRVGAMHKKDNKMKSCDCYTKNGEKGKRSHNNISREEILSSDKKAKRNSKSIIPFLNGTISSSSISEEEMEINLQLRPTLPRRPIDIPTFSPTDVWKSINLDFFKSHQQHSDSSEDGEDIMEEKIHRINRPVAPRRLIPDRSADSGISPDAGSPKHSPPNATWVPQHDLDDSEYGSETSEKRPSNEMMQPKFAMPNFMFPSKSLPRCDPKIGMEDREKGRSRDRRRKSSKNNETQHFNSLRNLKRALGIKSKVPGVDVNGLDSNWSLSRSLPNFANVNASDDVQPPNEDAPDPMRRSNSESRMLTNQMDALNWRQSSEGHVMYLPEYSSTAQLNDKKPTEEKQKGKKKFAYQSTMRQQEKKKLQEKLAKELEEKERKRETEIEWMNIVEDEFRKQRVREKSDVRQRLRFYALQVNKKSKSSKKIEKCTGDDANNLNHLNRVSSFMKDVQNITCARNTENCSHLTNVPQTVISQNNSFKEALNTFQSTYVSKMGFLLKVCNGQKAVNENERLVYESGRNENDLSSSSNESEGRRQSAEQKNVRHYVVRGNLATWENTLGNPHNKENASKDKESNYVLLNLQSARVLSKDQMSQFIQSRIDQEKDGMKNSLENNDISFNGQQPTGMKKWLRRQNRDHENIPRPEPEGDDCKHMDERGSQPIGANCRTNSKCSHGSGWRCGICNNSSSKVEINASIAEKSKDDTEEGHPAESELRGTFQSHSYYALERNCTENESVRKGQFFSSLNFEKELKENIREKRARKSECCDCDSDSHRKGARYHNSKKPSFSRNHPHRIKWQRP